jgi:hypothetical protein
MSLGGLTLTGSRDDEDARQTHEEEPAGDPGELFGLGGLNRQALLDWMSEHQSELRRSAFGNRLLYQSIVFCLVLGLVAHVSGYLLRSSDPTEPFGLLADLLYALGYALWTGSVVIVLLDVVPKVKRRQFRQMVQTYERTQREVGDQSPAERDVRDGAPGPAPSPGGGPPPPQEGE